MELFSCVSYAPGVNGRIPPGYRLYLAAAERAAFIVGARKALPDVRTLCAVLHDPVCRESEALELTPERVNLAGGCLILRTLAGNRMGSTGWPALVFCDRAVQPADRGAGESTSPLTFEVQWANTHQHHSVRVRAGPAPTKYEDLKK